MFNRHSIAIAVLALTALISARPADAQISRPCASKDDATGPVAKKLAEFKDHFYVSALSFNGDGAQLAVNFMMASDGVHVWNWRDPGRLIRSLDFPGGASDGHAMSFSPDGRLLAVRHGITDDGRVIRVWNAQTGEIVHDVVEHQGQGDAAGMAFSPDGKLLALTISNAIGPTQDQLLVFRTDTWELAWALRTMPFLATVVAFSPNGKLLALGGQEGPTSDSMGKPKILLVNADSRQILLTVDSPFLGAITPASLAWSADGLHLAVGSKPGDNSPEPEVVKIFEVATGKKIAGIPAKTATVTGLSYSPDGRYLIAGSIDNSVRILDGHTYILLQKIPGDARSVGVSRDSHYLAISAFPKIAVWELKQSSHLSH